MVKKMTSKSAAGSSKKSAAGAASGLMDSALAGAVKDSAQQIWLAGMGAFSKAQNEGGKVFDTLVKEGMNLQKKTQGMAEDKINEVTGKMSAMAETVTSRAGQNWDKLESIFEQRTAKAMNKLGVPTAKDVDALVKRVDDLAAAVARLSKSGLAQSAAPRKARAAAKAPSPFAAKPVKAAKAAAKAASKPAAKRAAKAASKPVSAKPAVARKRVAKVASKAADAAAA